MPSHLLLNKKLLAVAVSFAVMAEYSQAAPVVVTGDYTNPENVSIENTAGEAVSIEGSAINFTNNGTIQGKTNAIAVKDGKSIQLLTNTGTISSETGAAIKVATDGRINQIVNSGTITGGMVNGEQIAIDLRDGTATEEMLIELNTGSTINGNIHMNAESGNNVLAAKVILPRYATATFNGTEITGVNEIDLKFYSHLKLAAQDETIHFNLVDNGATNGFLRLDRSTLELELSGKLGENESVLEIDGDLRINDSSKIHLTGNVEKQGGKHTLIRADSVEYELDEVKKDPVNSDGLMTEGWLTEVKLLDNGVDSGEITVDITYKEDVNSETLKRDAMLGGADATEATYIGTFGEIALGSMTRISKYEIAFASDEHSELTTLLNNVGGDPAAAAQLAGELTADRSGATIYAAQNAINQNMSRIVARSLDIRNSHSSNHVDYGSSWLNVYGNTGSKDSNGRIDGFDIDGMGISFGTDGMIGNSLYAGFNLSYNQQDTQGVLYGTEHDLNSYQGALYALWNHDQLFVSTIASAGFNLYNSNRIIAGQDAKSNYDGYNLALRMTAGYDFEAGGVAIQPLVAAEINQLGIEAYEERGSVAPLGYEEQKIQQHKLGLGVNLSKNLTFRDRQFKPSLSVMGWHDLKADDRELDTYTIIDEVAIPTTDIASGSDYRYELTAGADYVSDDGEMKAGFNIQHSIEEGMQDTALLFQVKYTL